MANHRPKSLSELNNVYDKAMRAERAIKEGSDMLSIPGPETAPESENIFEQLESKAAKADKSQVFDPDITNIANDFLKRYAQPEKPKATTQEVKRPAPSIQVYHTPVKESEPKAEDIPLNMGSDFSSAFSAPDMPTHKPAHAVPATDSVKSQAETTVQPIAVPVAAPQVQNSVPATESAPVKAAPTKKYDHTPRPAPSRVRITSTERSELMDEYMRVMSDDDDEPSSKKGMFSFLKKKKKNDKDDSESTDSLYDGYNDEASDDTDSAVPVVAFDSSDVKYEDEYSDTPEEAQEDAFGEQEATNLYEYLEADFDYDAEDDEDDDEDGLLDMSFMSVTKPQEAIESPSQEITEEEVAEEITSEEYVAESEAQETQIIEPEEAEEVVSVTEEVQEEEVIYPAEEAEQEEAVVIPEEETVYTETPPTDMVFEDVFSVTDESKRSHTGGNWTEVIEEVDANQETIPTEEADDYSEEVVAYPEEETDGDNSTQPQTDAEHKEPQSQPIYVVPSLDDYDNEDYDDDDYEAPKKRTGLRILMSIAIVLCILGASVTALISTVIDIDSGKLISDKFRAFNVPETIETLGLEFGDLVITENVLAQPDKMFVYRIVGVDYGFGKVTETVSNLTGEQFYVAQTDDGVQLINRDTSMGIIIATYSGIGSVLSLICDNSLFIIIALAVLAIALIICLVIITKKRRLYEEASAIYDHMENKNTDDDSFDDDDENNSDDEYYSDYDTDGIEQGLFSDI